jgi:hypothetical protein
LTTKPASGVFGIAGLDCYANGTLASTLTDTWSGAIISLYIGCRNQNNAPDSYAACKIQALAIYSATLTAGEVATLTTLMNAL